MDHAFKQRQKSGTKVPRPRPSVVHCRQARPPLPPGPRRPPPHIPAKYLGGAGGEKYGFSMFCPRLAFEKFPFLRLHHPNFSSLGVENSRGVAARLLFFSRSTRTPAAAIFRPRDNNFHNPPRPPRQPTFPSPFPYLLQLGHRIPQASSHPPKMWPNTFS